MFLPIPSEFHTVYFDQICLQLLPITPPRSASTTTLYPVNFPSPFYYIFSEFDTVYFDDIQAPNSSQIHPASLHTHLLSFSCWLNLILLSKYSWVWSIVNLLGVKA